MKITIKHINGSLLFEGEYESIKLGVEDAVRLEADLSRADLSGADLSGAYLSGAYLYRAKYRDATIIGQPIQISGLRWDVLIIAGYIQIGCEEHLIADWRGFDDERIAKMDSRALEFWKENKERILAFCGEAKDG